MKTVIYGAGYEGRRLFRTLREMRSDSQIILFVDQNARDIGYIDSIPVKTIDEVDTGRYEFIISASKKVGDEIEKILIDRNEKYYRDISIWIGAHNIDANDFNRQFCAVTHRDFWDGYFISAESEKKLQIFWEGDFLRLFQNIDLDNVVELAVGHGRHVPKYIDKAKRVTLIDILPENIEYVKKRFQQYDNISYVCNNGHDLEELSSNEFSGLFSYDAMVHFEMLDIYSYLKEIYRVLKPGSYALLHHSNNTDNYKVSFNTGRQSRNYMSKDLFAYMAYQSGFEIVEQKVIDWVTDRDLDCLSLIRKP